jgi:Icc-related predicted phosphoesterase
MRILFVADLHGCVWKYRKVLLKAQLFQVDVVINGGDMLPKNGNLFQQDVFIREFLSEHFEQFERAGLSYLCYLGNDDLRIWDDLFEATCRRYVGIYNLAQRKVTIGGTAFVGMNWVSDYPFTLKDRCRMDTADFVFPRQFGPGVLSTPEGWTELSDWFAYARTLPPIAAELAALPRPDNDEIGVYVIHMPPHRLGLDVCAGGQQVGSKAVYEFLKTVQPALSLHGHIHESPEMSATWKAVLGSTMCVQPGQMDDFTYVVIDLQSMWIERYTDQNTSS